MQKLRTKIMDSLNGHVEEEFVVWCHSWYIFCCLSVVPLPNTHLHKRLCVWGGGGGGHKRGYHMLTLKYENAINANCEL